MVEADKEEGIWRRSESMIIRTCSSCGCLLPDDMEHDNQRDCLIAIASARGQLAEDQELANKTLESLKVRP